MGKQNELKMTNMVAKSSKAEQAKRGKQGNFGQIVPKAPPLQSKAPSMQRLDEGQQVPARPPASGKPKGKK